MAFRSPENLKRNELVRFDLESVIRAPGNIQEQQKRGYKFTEENRGNFFDWFNAFFEIQFKIDLKASGGDNADQLSTAVDAVGFALKRALTSNRKQINVKIPLNRYSFFEELEGRILPPVQLSFEIELNPDGELLFRSVDTTRVTIDRFYLWVPKILPKDSLMTKYIGEFQKPSRWKYLGEKHFTSAVTRNAVDCRIDSSIINARHVFVFLRDLKEMELTKIHTFLILSI